MIVTDSDRPPAFVATLGLQPQVITRALDKLMEIEPDIVQGTIIHTRAYRSHPDWPTFETFQRYVEKQYDAIDWEWCPIQETGKEPVDDVNSLETAELTFRLTFKIIRELKQQGYRLHTLIAGGRKSIIVYSMISAQLLFDVYDKLWHIFSKDENVRELSLRPHPPEDTVQLVEIPVFHLSGFMPMVRELILFSDDPTRAIRLYQEQEDMDYLVHLQHFYEACDSIDKRILLMRFHNFSNKEVAGRVHLGEPAIIQRLHRIADRLYDDPIVKRHIPKKPRQPQRAVLFALRPVLIKLNKPKD